MLLLDNVVAIALDDSGSRSHTQLATFFERMVLETLVASARRI